MQNTFWKISSTMGGKDILTDDEEELFVAKAFSEELANHIVTLHNLHLLSKNDDDRYEDIKME